MVRRSNSVEKNKTKMKRGPCRKSAFFSSLLAIKVQNPVTNLTYGALERWFLL